MKALAILAVAVGAGCAGDVNGSRIDLHIESPADNTQIVLGTVVPFELAGLDAFTGTAALTVDGGDRTSVDLRMKEGGFTVDVATNGLTGGKHAFGLIFFDDGGTDVGGDVVNLTLLE